MTQQGLLTHSNTNVVNMSLSIRSTTNYKLITVMPFYRIKCAPLSDVMLKFEGSVYYFCNSRSCCYCSNWRHSFIFCKAVAISNLSRNLVYKIFVTTEISGQVLTI